ncbi:MAG TPA: YjbQ family protein [Anaerolineae bacterium]|nr:YjbQ family protein [Anaerolineae bacterium]
MIHTDSIQLSTRGHADMHDLTPHVDRIVRETRMQDGVVTLFTPSSTSALTTIEFESGALQDLRRALDEIAPPDQDYQHNLRWGDGNGHSHLRAALLGPSLSIPFTAGSLTLGTWQQILFIDFDVRARQRKIVVQVVGEDPA